MSFMDRMKRASKAVADAGAKTMLKTDIMFLEREIKSRKQKFGIEIYDLMEELENNDSLSVTEKENKIRAAFDSARKDIAVIQAKKECKKEEVAVLDAESAVGSSPYSGTPTHATTISGIPPSSGQILTNSHPSDTGLMHS